MVIGVSLCLTGDVENGLRVVAIGGVGYLGAETIVDVARAIWSTGTAITIEDTTEADFETEDFDEDDMEMEVTEE